MPSVRQASAVLAAVLAASLAPAVPTHAAPRERPSVVGTYERVARDVVAPDGTMRDVYDDVLRTGDRTYRLRLPKGMHLHGGTPVRVHGTVSGQDMAAADVEQLGAATAVPATGTTKALVILAYWTGKAKDSVTQAQAAAQIFTDDDGWFGEASYGQLSVTGAATPWVQIPPPASDDCYSLRDHIMDNAKVAAKALNGTYDSALFDRTIVYFPRCYGGNASGAAGWAYEPGTSVWLNGFMDRRVSVHEQGHNYNLPHAHTYECNAAGTRVTLGGSCGSVEYGDDYDAMGGSNYSAHFSGPQKNILGWVTARKLALTSGVQTFTLPPFENTGATPVVAVATTGTRKYWIEYRRAIGYDATLPAAATAGVLVHLVDTSVNNQGRTDGAYLLDTSPQNSFASDAVITSGGTWTSPEGVRISVGAVSTTGATVTVDGSADPPTVPGVPRNVTASGGDGSVHLAWDAPLSNGGSSVSRYVVTRTAPAPSEQYSVDAPATALDLGFLDNGTAYSYTVAASNGVGTGVASGVVSATPVMQVPSVTVTSPGNGAVLTGMTTLTAAAQPNAVSQSPIQYVELAVDGEPVGWSETAPWTAEWDATTAGDGPHTVTATAYDENGRYATSAPVAVTVDTPHPSVAITSPLDGAAFGADTVTLAASATPAGGGAPVQRVEFQLQDGTPISTAWEAPYEVEWNVAGITGARTVVAKAVDEDGRSGFSAPVTLTFSHPAPTVTFTAPAAGATVSGSAVTIASSPVPSAVSGDPVSYVTYSVAGNDIGTAYGAPWEITWDSSAFSGEQTLTATAYDWAGHAGSATREVTVLNDVPSATVTSPAAGAVVGGTQVPITATATPNATSNAPIDHVVITVDGEQVGSIAAPGPYTASWPVSQRYGQHTVVATAYDDAGQSAPSAPVTFTVPYPAPSVVVTSPTGGSTVKPGLLGIVAQAAPDVVTGTPVQRADFFAGGVWIGEDTDPSNGLTLVWNAPVGAHSLTVEVTDGDLFTGVSPAVAVTVANAPGAPTAVTATAGLNGTATVSWSAPASDGGSPVTSYVVKTGTLTKVASGSPFTFTGLANGTSYAFSVQARNAAGDGPFSTLTTAVKPGTPTTVAITAITTPVNFGGVVTVSGTLKKGATAIAGKTVQLVTCPNNSGTCTAVGSGTTSSTGVVRIATYKPPAHKYLRLRFLQSNELLASLSAQKLVQVRAVVTAATNKTSMPLGGTATITGTVKPAHSGQRVYLQRYYGGAWHETGLYKVQTSTGAVPGFAVKPTVRGTYVYRLSFRGDADHLAGLSPNVTVKVT